MTKTIGLRYQIIRCFYLVSYAEFGRRGLNIKGNYFWCRAMAQYSFYRKNENNSRGPRVDQV